MQGDRQLDDAEPGTEVAASAGHRINGFPAQFIGELFELLGR
jgi:hypothetical protein